MVDDLGRELTRLCVIAHLQSGREESYGKNRKIAGLTPI